MAHYVIKHTLSNGLTILVRPVHDIPKVSTQLWYNVGSKDEKSGEKGIAHFIEHMLFKGTKKLSECDINLITHKLSGYANAFTSYDYTGYLFDFPSQNWLEALPILADCMRNATFKEAFLNSELKAVIQELKLYKDDYTRSLIELLVSAIFSDHPYHNPIIGYKQDLWSLSRENLVHFYEHHYVPNNATLIVVGDAEPDDVFKRAEKEFGHFPASKNYKKEEFYHSPDLISHAVTIYRDTKIPLIILAWQIPGAKTANDYLIDIVSWIIGSGKGSRLYKKLVDELQLVTDLEAFTYDLFDQGIFFIFFQPKDIATLQQIVAVIQEELHELSEAAVSQQELTRAIKKIEIEHLALLENHQKQAYGIGRFYLATQDEQYLYTYTHAPKDHLVYQIKDFVRSYLRPSLMHKGAVLPLAPEERSYWIQLQEISDQEDERVLKQRSRTEVVEEGKCVTEIQARPPKPFTFARAKMLYLDNGLKVLYCNNPLLPKIDILIDFDAKQEYDPAGKEGVCSFVALLLVEGTKNYSAQELIDTIESLGMTLQTTPGFLTLSMLAADLPKGLELLQEILVYATFPQEAIEKVRAQMLADLDEFWDNPAQFVTQLARQEIYREHPSSKNVLGTVEGINAITREDIVDFYKRYMSPKAARLAIVGDISQYDIQHLLGQKLFAWQGKPVEPLVYPPLEPVKRHEIAYPILRDQTALCYAGLSVARMDQDYEKLLLFDQIFTGGVLGSMASRLFDVREQTGLFYTIGGSLVYRVDKQRGLIIVKTIVSNDRLSEAEHAIEHVINTAIDTLSDDELEQARQAVVNSLVDNFSSSFNIAITMLFKDKFNLPDDYFDKRAGALASLTKQQVQETVKKYLTTDKMVLIRAGRV